jgi:DNA-directed RNA polymerase specialized sigma24 family protein
MSWFDGLIPTTDSRNQASVAEVVACFQGQRSLLRRLAFLITGDQATAEQAVVNACELILHRHSPFRDWLFEWAKAATITSAISRRAAAIRACEADYEIKGCTHQEHLSPGDAEEHASRLQFVLETDPKKLTVQLDPLCRAMLVLRVATRSSIQDCVLRLNVCRAAVLGANCRAMSWLEEYRLAAEGQHSPLPVVGEQEWRSGEAW